MGAVGCSAAHILVRQKAVILQETAPVRMPMQPERGLVRVEHPLEHTVDPVSGKDMLQLVQDMVSYNRWFCGHYHQSWHSREDRFQVLYEEIIPFKEGGSHEASI